MSLRTKILGHTTVTFLKRPSFEAIELLFLLRHRGRVGSRGEAVEGKASGDVESSLDGVVWTGNDGVGEHDPLAEGALAIIDTGERNIDFRLLSKHVGIGIRHQG